MRAAILSIFASAALLGLAFAPGVGAGEEPAGQQVFLGQKCEMCHSVSTAGIEAKTKSEKMFGGDLIDLEGKYDAEWLGNYLMKQEQLEGEDHKKEFKGSGEELKALVDWLLEQKSE